MIDKSRYTESAHTHGEPFSHNKKEGCEISKVGRKLTAYRKSDHFE